MLVLNVCKHAHRCLKTKSRVSLPSNKSVLKWTHIVFFNTISELHKHFTLLRLPILTFFFMLIHLGRCYKKGRQAVSKCNCSGLIQKPVYKILFFLNCQKGSFKNSINLFALNESTTTKYTISSDIQKT